MEAEKSSSADIWVFIEPEQEGIKRVSLELLCEGRRLADQTGERLCGVFLGENPKIDELCGAYGADIVYTTQNPSPYLNIEAGTKALEALVRTFIPSIFLFGATYLAQNLAPRLAARLNIGLTADCLQLEVEKETHVLKQTKPSYGGKLMTTIVCPEKRPQMATVRPGVMKLDKPVRKKAKMVTLPVDLTNVNTTVEVAKVALSPKNIENLASAEVIIACGRGAKNKEIICAAARILGATIGGTRAAYNAQLIDHHQQIGQTGVTVRPRLYIACGISGAVQHMVGVQGAETMVAINTDRNAPIFEIADYGLVGDYKEILPLFCKEWATRSDYHGNS